MNTNFILDYLPHYNIKDILTDDYSIINGKKKGNNISYINISAGFDIEVSSFYENSEKRACMYIYMIGINGKVKIGRTWSEFMEDINDIILHYDLNISKRLIIYVHNLSYEFQFIKDRFTWYDMFCLTEREPIYAVTDNGIEFRCSYILSNYSLALVGEHLTKYKVNKLVGDLDYTLLRGSKTKLTDKELQYCINDVLVVMAYIQELIEEYGLINIPLTSTGFVRNYCRNICFESKYYRKNIKKLKLSTDVYYMLKLAFQGGFTHSNPFMTDKIIKNVDSFDFTSSYPTVLISEQYPMSSPLKVDDYSNLDYYLKNFACLIDITFTQLKSKELYEYYISKSKALELSNDYVISNGRIVKANKLRMIITEVDYGIIKHTYTFTTTINKMYIFKKAYLPKEFITIILKLYNDKTKLKGVENKEEEYHKAKKLLNAMYGMCVTDPCKDMSMYDDHQWHTNEVDIEDKIESYNNSYNRFLYYPWGVWCTAYARYNLWQGITNIKYDYIYSDTDSIKLINLEQHKDFFANYNKQIISKLLNTVKWYGLNEELIQPKNIKDEPKPLGVWDHETIKKKYKYFKTLGAKRYLIIYNDNDIAITISGVNKKEGAKYLLNYYKTTTNILNAFTNNLIFPVQYTIDGVTYKGAGKTIDTYIDLPHQGCFKDYQGTYNIYNELSSLHISKSDYSLSLDNMFAEYIKNIKSNYLLI